MLGAALLYLLSCRDLREREKEGHPTSSLNDGVEGEVGKGAPLLALSLARRKATPSKQRAGKGLPAVALDKRRAIPLPKRGGRGAPLLYSLSVAREVLLSHQRGRREGGKWGRVAPFLLAL